MDSQFVQSYFETQYAIADSLVIHNKFRSVREYESIIQNFTPYFELKAAQQKAEAIKNSPEYKGQIAERAANIKEENELYEKFSKVYSNDILAAKSDDNFKWWRKELKRLDIDIENATMTSRGKMLKRLKYTVYAGIYESSMMFIGSEKYKHALYCDHVLVHFNPEQAYWYYRLAESYARNDNFSSTIKQLKKAKELGLKGFQRVENAPVFAKFKNKRKFKKLFENQLK